MTRSVALPAGRHAEYHPAAVAAVAAVDAADAVDAVDLQGVVTVNGVAIPIRETAGAARGSSGLPVAARIKQVALGAAIGLLILVAAYAALQTRQAGDVDVAGDSDAYQLLEDGGAGGVLRPGAALPDVELVSMDGSRAHLSDFRGRPLWVNVWATWCPPCRAEMPEVDALYRELAPQGLAVAAISISEDSGTVQRFLQTAGYLLPIYLSPDGQAANALRVNGLPTHYFVGRDGKIRDVRFGGMSSAAMRAKLARIL